MAGDWIPYCKDLPRKPEVLAIAAITNLTIPEVLHALLELWSWADEQSQDGHIRDVPVTLLRHICASLDAAFLQALSRVGWVRVEADHMTFTNFDRWMGRSAKARLSHARRQREHRHNQHAAPCGDDDDGTGVTPDRHKNVTTEQNRTEESRGMNSPTTPSCPETSATSSGPHPAAAPPPSPTVLTFPTDGNPKSWDLTEAVVAELAAAYPSLDVLAEARKALAWVQADASRKKTARGMRRFLTGWLGRAQDSGRGRKPGAAPPPQETTEERLARLRAQKGPQP